MIHYLKIENFGPIKDTAEMNFEVTEQPGEDAYEVEMPDQRRLLKLAYIYGANASGKTTVLKAFEFLRKLLLKPVSDKAIELDFEPFLFRNNPYKVPSLFELSFYLNGIRYVYSVKFTRQSIVEERILFYQTAKPTELFSRSTDMNKRLAKIQFGSKIKVPVRERDLLESNTLHNNTVIGAYARTNVDIPELEILNKWFNVFLLGMVTTSQNLTEVTASMIDESPAMNKWINSFLNKADYQISEVNVSDITNQIIVPPDEVLHGASSQRKIDFVHTVDRNKNYVLSILAESSGTKRYFGLGGLLYQLIHGGHMLCIDELETSLHPDLMKYFLQAFLMNAKESQMFISTHNISLMENQDFIRRDALWFSEKDKHGAVSIYAAADFDSTTLRKDASIINAYRSGRLGAKPNLGSPYLPE